MAEYLACIYSKIFLQLQKKTPTGFCCATAKGIQPLWAMYMLLGFSGAIQYCAFTSN